MADNYQRQNQSFRAVEKSSVEYPVTLVGAHVRTYTGTQTLAASTASQTLTVPAGSEFADIYVQGTASTDFVRYWHGGTVPTSTSGSKIKDHEIVASADPATFRVILGSGSGSCTLYIEYYKYV